MADVDGLNLDEVLLCRSVSLRVLADQRHHPSPTCPLLQVSRYMRPLLNAALSSNCHCSFHRKHVCLRSSMSLSRVTINALVRRWPMYHYATMLLELVHTYC